MHKVGKRIKPFTKWSALQNKCSKISIWHFHALFLIIDPGLSCLPSPFLSCDLHPQHPLFHSVLLSSLPFCLKVFLFKSCGTLSNFSVFIHIYAHLDTHIQWSEARIHVWERTCLSEPGLPHLECFPSNFLKTSQFQISLLSIHPFTDGCWGILF